jgi:iron complex outermembrane recepter protein
MISKRCAAPVICLGVVLFTGVACYAADPIAATEPATGAEASSAGLEEVIVTAQKKAENLQRTAVAITSISGDALVAAGANDIYAAQNLMPSVRFQTEGASTEIYVRGVGSTVDLPNNEPPVAFNFNGAYVPREGTSVGFYDIDRIELLPGPQGTLYGRSSLGGAINVSFNRPANEQYTKFSFEAGNYSLFHGTLIENLPLTDKLAVRGAFDYVTNDGYLTSGADSLEDWATRLSALYQATDDLTVYVWGSLAEKHGVPSNLVGKGDNNHTGVGDQNAYDTSNPWNDAGAEAGSQTYNNKMIGGQVDYRFSNGATLTYIPSYFYLDWASNYWIENVPAFLTAHYNQISNELRLANVSGKWNWLAGVYQYGVTNSGLFEIGGFPVIDVTRNRSEGVAAFGQATYSWTDSLRTIVGGRFSHDKRSGEGLTSFGVPFSADQDYNHADWKVGVEYDLRAATMAYATVQTAYQPGSYNTFPNTAAESNFVQSAKLTAYSAGIKNRSFDEHLQVNNEVFYYDYKNLFAQSTNLGTGLLTTFNAKKVEVYGDQLDVLFQPTSVDRLNISVGYLHGRNIDFTIPEDINVGTSVRNFGGYQLSNAPDWTVSGGYQHDVHIGSGYLRARADSRYEDSFWGDYAHTRGTHQNPYFKTDVSLTYYASSSWSAGLWVKNISNVAVQSATAGGLGNWGATFLEPPRTFGVRGSVQF